MSPFNDLNPMRAAIGCLAMFLVGSPAMAHDMVPGEPQAGPIVIRGGTVHVGDGGVIENGSVLFVDGTITAIGEQVDSPDDATVVDAAGKHVYPGLIESLTDLGLIEISAVDVTIDKLEFGTRNPNVRSWVAVNPDSELIPVTRAGGVLIAHVVPGGRLFQGQSGVVMLDGWSVEEMALSTPAGLCVNWESIVPRGDDAKKNAKAYDAQLKQFDDDLKAATRYRDARESDPETTAFDVRLESLVPVVNGERTVYVIADSLGAIESAVHYFTARDIPIVICGGHDAVACADLLKLHDIPVIVGGIYRLPRRRQDAYDSSYTLPARLLDAGVRFAIRGEGAGYPSGGSNARNLPMHAGHAVAFGLPREEGIRAITSSAAEILGVDDRVGSIKTGLDATLIIADGDVLESETTVTDAFIQGRRVDLNNRHRQLYDKYKQKYE